MTTALISHPDCTAHATPDGHPEQIARWHAVQDALADLDPMRMDAPLAGPDDALRCHPQEYIDRVVQSEPATGSVQMDADTHMSPGSVRAAWRSLGGVICTVDTVLGGTARNAFAAGRPPGHHAERQSPMGFCLFGNVAIAAKHALDHHGLSRVAIVDFDVHHGNGTEDLVQDDPRILFVSSHQMPLYPDTGEPSHTGPHNTVVNVALDAGCDGPTFRDIYERLILPRLADFAPELMILSAGFDAHADDPLAQCALNEDDFTWVTDRLCDIAWDHCDGRVVSALEGGYNLDALGRSARAHVETLIRRNA